MTALVIYYSKTGNTKQIAEAMARVLHTEALPLILPKKGRRSKVERVEEKALWAKAISESRDAEVVLVGTPTEFRRPHPVVVEFIKQAHLRSAAVFCTCYGMTGATLIDAEALLRQHGTRFMGGLAVCIGTDQYRARQDVTQYVEKITDEHLSQAREFARGVVRSGEPVKPRLQGACGKDCRQCPEYKHGRCEGAAVRCWSGRGCPVFECAVIRSSLSGCGQCQRLGSCRKRASV